jgi:transposase
MAMKRRAQGRQGEFWIATQDIVKSKGHPFYEALNRLFADAGFDRLAEDRCAKFYAEKMGRPSVPPGVYFRMLMVGYFEGIDSEREIAWRCHDSNSLRGFLGYRLDENTPEHSTLSVIRQRIDLETHLGVFVWVLKRVAEHGLLKGKTLGIDGTTLEANAAMRSIVRRDTGEGYREFLERLASESGIETPTAEDLAKIDRQRKHKASNKDWEHPHDPDAKVAKMKDGRTHLAHKAEHATDLDSGAVVAVALHGADLGDTATVRETLNAATANLREVKDDPHAGEQVSDELARELVGDKGYHSNDVLRDLDEMEVRSYISEPKRPGKRVWKDKEAERRAVYGNRRRIKGRRGKALLRKRGELLERSFAHGYGTGGMRRTHLRGHENILKRVLIHFGGLNLGLVMRRLFGVGTPRGLQDRARAFAKALCGVLSALPWSTASFRRRLLASERFPFPVVRPTGYLKAA